MKKISIFLLGLFFGLGLYSQGEPVMNYEEVLDSGQLQWVQSWLYRSEDTVGAEKRLLFREEFDRKGKKLSSYYFCFWDMVSWDRETTYSYDDEGKLTEESTLTRELELNERDREYIDAIGTGPTFVLVRYVYDSEGKKIREEKYHEYGEKLSPGTQPSGGAVFKYDQDGQIIKVIRGNPNKPGSWELTTYEYDKDGNKLGWTVSKKGELLRKISLGYNDLGQKVREKVKDFQVDLNSYELKVEYDEAGRMRRTYAQDKDSGEWIMNRDIKYNGKGYKVHESDNTTFTYDERGLIIQELWKSPDSGEVVNFITEYQIFEH